MNKSVVRPDASFLFGKKSWGLGPALQLPLFIAVIFFISIQLSSWHAMLLPTTHSWGNITLTTLYFSEISLSGQDISSLESNEHECQHPGLTRLAYWVCEHPHSLPLVSLGLSAFFRPDQAFILQGPNAIKDLQVIPLLKHFSPPVPSPPPKIIF